ncbi:MAG: hypothetical protein F6J93_01420 [Oscillatoria sp. SIO1A7]|nr:hypothetical protein [Oscillatoria sp. SIO1A7]
MRTCPRKLSALSCQLSALPLYAFRDLRRNKVPAFGRSRYWAMPAMPQRVGCSGHRLGAAYGLVHY